MAKDSHAYIEQSGVVPYRIKNGRVEVALVTATSGPHWTIPKGHIEPKMSAQESAAKEAMEESGLLGTVTRDPLGSYVYEKRGRLRQVKVFPMAVTRQLRTWPEHELRQRRWMSADAAAARVRSAELRCCIQRLARSVSRVKLARAA